MTRVWWDEYEVYDPGVSGLWRDLRRREAKAAYERLMAARPHRLVQLRELSLRHGLVLGDDDPSIQRLDDWFRANVSSERSVRDHPDTDAPCRLLPEWYSVVSDISLYLGDIMVRRNPQLRWEFFTRGRKHVSYQQNVIAGFGDGSRQHLNVDLLVVTHAYRVVLGLPVDAQEFVSIVREAETP